ncbi:transmembrane protein, putative [Medicago truncatula]|uniref:Transmembrane protein, putative n=1 Tax=Medicago truncatula TaxID=3880 RepID=A0A072USD1_MEDTR|nr:transmembrane protein, putative [Medicago truncatula]
MANLEESDGGWKKISIKVEENGCEKYTGQTANGSKNTALAEAKKQQPKQGKNPQNKTEPPGYQQCLHHPENQIQHYLAIQSPWQIAECRGCAPKRYSGMNLHRNAGNNTAIYSGHTWYFTETSLTTSIWLLCGLLLAVLQRLLKNTT